MKTAVAIPLLALLAGCAPQSQAQWWAQNCGPLTPEEQSLYPPGTVRTADCGIQAPVDAQTARATTPTAPTAGADFAARNRQAAAICDYRGKAAGAANPDLVGSAFAEARITKACWELYRQTGIMPSP